MGISKSLEESERNCAVMLKVTKKINKKDTEADPAWKMVSEEYAENKESEWLTKATVSIINSIIYQRRVVFILSRESCRELLKNDPNWSPSIGLKNDNYPLIIRRICKGLVEKIGQIKTNKTGRYVMIFKVVHPEILKYLQVDTIEQLREAQNFQKTKTKDQVDRDIEIYQFMSDNFKDKIEKIKKMEQSPITAENKKAEQEYMVLFEEAKIKYMEKKYDKESEIQ